MKCCKCDKEADWDFGDESLCQEHFEEMCDITWWELCSPFWVEPVVK